MKTYQKPITALFLFASMDNILIASVQGEGLNYEGSTDGINYLKPM